MEQRKFERMPARLEVEIRTRGRGQVCPSTNVSRHGMFLVTPNPPHDRQLLILRIPLSDRQPPIDVMASVVRRISTEDADARTLAAGMGINFFALTEENKRRWESYLARLRGESALPAATPNRPTFLLQPKDSERLKLFASTDFAIGFTFLRTPVLHPLGELIQIVLVHPVNGAEFPLLANVKELHDGARGDPKGMTLAFRSNGKGDRQELQEFVETGLLALRLRPAAAPPDVQRAVQPPPIPRDALDSSDDLDAVEEISVNLEEPELPFGEHAVPDEFVSEAWAEAEATAAAAADAAEEGALAPSDSKGPTLDPPGPLGRTSATEGWPVDSAASANWRTGGLEAQVAALRRALEDAPDDVALLFRLGSLLAREEATAEEGLSVLLHLQTLEPHHPLCNGMLALAHAKLGRHSDAHRHAARARRLGQPVDAQALSLLASPTHG